MVVNLAHNKEVTGSSPVESTKVFKQTFIMGEEDFIDEENVTLSDLIDLDDEEIELDDFYNEDDLEDTNDLERF